MPRTRLPMLPTEQPWTDDPEESARLVEEAFRPKDVPPGSVEAAFRAFEPSLPTRAWRGAKRAVATLPGLLPSGGEPPFALDPSMERRKAQFAPLIERIAGEEGLDVRLLHAMVERESQYNPRAVSKKGAQGLLQLMPDTQTEIGVGNPWDAEANLRGGARYLKKMLAQHGGDLRLALAAYNAGPGAVAQHKGIPPFPETQQYVDFVMGRLQPQVAPKGAARAVAQPFMILEDLSLAPRAAQLAETSPGEAAAAPPTLEPSGEAPPVPAEAMDVIGRPAPDIHEMPPPLPTSDGNRLLGRAVPVPAMILEGGQLVPNPAYRPLTPEEGGMGIFASPGNLGLDVLLGTQQGLQYLTNLLSNTAMLADRLADVIGNITGTEKGGAFQVAQEVLRQVGEDIQANPQLLQERNWFTNRLFQALGAVIPQFGAAAVAVGLGGPIAGFAALGALSAADQGLLAAAIKAAENAVLGVVLRGTAGLPRTQRLPLVGGTFGGVTLAETGDISQALVQALIGAGLALPGALGGPSLSYRLRHFWEVFRTGQAPVMDAPPEMMARDALLMSLTRFKQGSSVEDVAARLQQSMHMSPDVAQRVATNAHGIYQDWLAGRFAPPPAEAPSPGAPTTPTPPAPLVPPPLLPRGGTIETVGRPLASPTPPRPAPPTRDIPALVAEVSQIFPNNQAMQVSLLVTAGVPKEEAERLVQAGAAVAPVSPPEIQEATAEMPTLTQTPWPIGTPVRVENQGRPITGTFTGVPFPGGVAVQQEGEDFPRVYFARDVSAIAPAPPSEPATQGATPAPALPIPPAPAPETPDRALYGTRNDPHYDAALGNPRQAPLFFTEEAPRAPAILTEALARVEAGDAATQATLFPRGAPGSAGSVPTGRGVSTGTTGEPAAAGEREEPSGGRELAPPTTVEEEGAPYAATLAVEEPLTPYGVKPPPPTPPVAAPITQGQSLFEPGAFYAERPDATPQTRQLAREALNDLTTTAHGDVSSLRGGMVARERAREQRGAAGAVVLYRHLPSDAYLDSLRQTGRAAFVGQKATNSHDIAVLGQAVRDPRIERLFWIFTKGDEVVAVDVVSSRLPSLSQAFLTPRGAKADSQPRHIATLRRRMQRMEADGYYLLHNHPSGKVDPSRDDRALTRNVATHLPGFQGHVVIDHGIYSVLDSAGQTIHMGGVPVETQDPFGAVGEGRTYIQGPGEIMQLGQGFTTGPHVILFFRDNAGYLRSTQVVPRGLFASAAFPQWLRGQQRSVGAREIITYQSHSTPAIASAAEQWYRQGLLLDHITPLASMASEMPTLYGKTTAAQAPGGYRVSEEPTPFPLSERMVNFLRQQLASGQTTPEGLEQEGVFARYPGLRERLGLEEPELQPVATVPPAAGGAPPPTLPPESPGEATPAAGPEEDMPPPASPEAEPADVRSWRTRLQQSRLTREVTKAVGTQRERYQAVLQDKERGAQAYNRELLYQIRRASGEADIAVDVGRALTRPEWLQRLERIPYVTERSAVQAARILRALPWIGGRVGVRRSEQPLLFDVAEAILSLDAEGHPVFGTRKFFRDRQGNPILDEAGEPQWEWRFTQGEGEAMWQRLSPQAQEAARWWVVERESLKEAYNVLGGVEGYMHHFWQHGVLDGFRRLNMKRKTAAPRKLRREAQGYFRHFEQAVSKGWQDLHHEQLWNDFILQFREDVTDPIDPEQGVRPGWREIPGLRSTRTGQPVGQLGARRQIPVELYDDYIRHVEAAAEVFPLAALTAAVGRFFKTNVLVHPGTAATNFLSGGIQFATKLVEDFWQGALHGRIRPLLYDLIAPLDALRPSTIANIPPELFGAESNVRTQFGPPRNIIDRLNSVQLWHYGAIENYWKRVIASSELRTQGMALDRDTIVANDTALATLNEAVDAWAFNYRNIPRGLQRFRASAIGALLVPFPTYGYKLLRMYSRYGGALNPVVQLDPRDRFARLLTLGTILTLAYLGLGDDEEKVGPFVEGMPYRVDKTSRVKLGTTEEGKEQYLRVIKYPWLNAMHMIDAGGAILTGATDRGMQALGHLFDDFMSEGPLLQGLYIGMGMGNRFDFYQPKSVRLARAVQGFIPGTRLAQDVRKLHGGPRFYPTTFWEALAPSIPLPLPYETTKGGSKLALERVPYLDANGQVKHAKQPVLLDPTLEQLKFWLGVNIKEIDPTDYALEKRQRLHGALKSIEQAHTPEAFARAKDRLALLLPELRPQLDKVNPKQVLLEMQDRIAVIRLMQAKGQEPPAGLVESVQQWLQGYSAAYPGAPPLLPTGTTP